MRRVTIFFLIVICALLLTPSAFALTKKEQAWKEDILTLLSLVKRVGDYSEVVDLIEVAPALKEDPEIRKAFITFAPPGVTPPEWVREEEKAPTEVPKKIVTAKEKERREREEEEARRIVQGVAAQKKVREREEAPPVIREVPEKIEEEMKEEEARRIAQEVAAQRETAPPEIIKEEEARRIAQEVVEQKKDQEKEEARRIVQEITAQKKVREREEAPSIEGPPEKIGIVEEAPVKEAIKEELGAIPTSLPQGAKVIYSTDVVSGVKAEIVEGKMKVTITLSGERKYTTSERTRPPAIVIDIPHTINAIFPERIMVNQGCVRTIEVTQHRALPFDETRIMVVLNRWTEYRVTHKDNEIYIDFEE